MNSRTGHSLIGGIEKLPDAPMLAVFVPTDQEMLQIATSALNSFDKLVKTRGEMFRKKTYEEILDFVIGEVYVPVFYDRGFSNKRKMFDDQGLAETQSDRENAARLMTRNRISSLIKDQVVEKLKVLSIVGRKRINDPFF